MISFIWAQSHNGVIGKDQKLPWKIKEELVNFKRITLNHKIIMGRKTWDSIKKALPNRENIVISRNQNLKLPDSVILINNINEIINQYQNSEEEVFIIGGSYLFNAFLKYVTKLYVSFIKQNYQGNVYMTSINYDNFNLISNTKFDEFELKIYKKK